MLEVLLVDFLNQLEGRFECVIGHSKMVCVARGKHVKAILETLAELTQENLLSKHFNTLYSGLHQ